MSEKFGEPFIVVLHFWRPIAVGGIGIIPKLNKKTMKKTRDTFDCKYLRSIGTLSFSLLKLFPVPVCDCGRCGSRRLEKDGLGVDSGSASSSGRDIVSAWRMPGGNVIEEKVISSWEERTSSDHIPRVSKMENHTSNDWAYQSFTFLMDGIALRLWGSSSSSFTRWARRTGSSSKVKIK